MIVISDAIHPGRARSTRRRGRQIVEVDGLNVPALLEAVRDADALVVRSETEVTEEVLASRGGTCVSSLAPGSASTIST